MKITMKKHDSGWFWPLLGVLVVVIIIWWAMGNQSSVPLAQTATTTPEVVGQQKPATVHPVPAKGKAGTDVISVADGISNGTTFSSWLKSTGVASELSQTGSYTLFLPTNAAVVQLPTGTFHNLSVAEQKRFVEYHIIVGKIINIEAVVAGTIQTLSGDPLNFTHQPSQPALVGSYNVIAEYKASNGVVYVINGVLIPPHRSTI